jgi:hypothetical protein
MSNWLCGLGPAWGAIACIVGVALGLAVFIVIVALLCMGIINLKDRYWGYRYCPDWLRKTGKVIGVILLILFYALVILAVGFSVWSKTCNAAEPDSMFQVSYLDGEYFDLIPIPKDEHRQINPWNDNYR